MKDKLFIFFTHAITDIGGAQLYISSKISKLQEDGWDILVFSCINGEYIIKSYNIQLNHNGSMSITATKAEELIL